MQPSLNQAHVAGHQELYRAPKGAGYGAAIIAVPWPKGWHRRRMNVVAMCVCLFVPWLLFCFMYWAGSFHYAFRTPALSYMIMAFGLLMVLLIGYKVFEAARGMWKSHIFGELPWLAFLLVTCLLAWMAGVTQGQFNFYGYMEPFFGLRGMTNYKLVDVGKTDGLRYMDAGRITFVPGTHLDLTRSMSFRNNDLYCVAPIVGPNASIAGGPDSYDFWAVGLNCCCGGTGSSNDFRCDDYKATQATGAIRLMRDSQRPFYRLAVQQAEGKFGLKASHPLFFKFVQDPALAVEAYQYEGYRQFLIWIYGYFFFQLLLVALAACIFWHFEEQLNANTVNKEPL